MNESLLDALIKLFALLVKSEPKYSENLTNEVLEKFLLHDFGREQTKSFLKDYREYCQTYNFDSEVDPKDILQNPDVKSIIEGINHELEQQQKVWLILQLLEFIGDSSIGTERRLTFIKELALSFNISEFEFSNGRDFILGESSGQIPWNQQVLLIDSSKDNTIPEIKHLTNDRLNGQIYILHIASSHTYLLKYFGDQELFINSRNIKPGRTYIFGVGAVVRGARIKHIYYSKVASVFTQDPRRPFVSIVVDNVRYKHKGSHNGIYPFSFKANSGQLVGIMGGSGVGKSTLLNLLNGNLKPRSGHVYINGHDVHENSKQLEGVIGYVPQDDLLVEELTVFQNLYYNALLCFRNFSKKKVLDIVEQTINDFDLVEAHDLRVGDPLNKFISGGQRKRLNMAMEIMREPSVLFVDEPTSGLSSMDAERVMLLLRKQTFKGKIVFANIHQPSSDLFKLFDTIIVLDHGGRPIFQGNPMDAVVYFKRMGNYLKPEESECITCGNVNTDIILKVVEARVVNEYGKLTRKRKRSANEWYELYLQNIDSKLKITIPTNKSLLPPNDFSIPGYFRQMWIFFRRNLRSKLANSQFMNVSILASPILAVIVSFFTRYAHGTAANPNLYIFSQNDNIPSYLFMSVVAMMFLGLTMSAEDIIKDRKILYREKFLNLSYFSYINSKLIVLFIFSALQSFMFVAIGNSVLEIKGMFFEYWLVLFSTVFCSNLIGLNLSAAFKSVVAIYVMIPIILVPQLLFSGVVVDYSKLHKSIANPEYTPVIGDLMLSRWAYEALCVEQFESNRYNKHFFDVDMQISNDSYNATLLIPKLQSLVNEIKVDLLIDKQQSRLQKDLVVIKDGIVQLSVNYPIRNFQYPDTSQLNADKVNLEYIDELSGDLSVLKTHFGVLHQKAVAKRDSMVFGLDSLLKENGSSLFALSRKFQNDALTNLVTNRNNYEKIVQEDNRLIRKYEPVYAPSTSSTGRAPLFASFKRVGHVTVSTLWFNVMVIWVMSVVFYLSLLSDFFRVLHKATEWFRFRKLAARIARYLPS